MRNLESCYVCGETYKVTYECGETVIDCNCHSSSSTDDCEWGYMVKKHMRQVVWFAKVNIARAEKELGLELRDEPDWDELLKLRVDVK